MNIQNWFSLGLTDLISLQSKGLSSFLWCQIIITITDYIGLPSWLSSKESACNAEATGDVGLIPGLGRSLGGEHGNLLQYSCLENPHRQRSLAGCGPRDHKESGTTKQLTQKCLCVCTLLYTCTEEFIKSIKNRRIEILSKYYVSETFKILFYFILITIL